jgi:predicted GNAT superfamily acetyltransferase
MELNRVDQHESAVALLREVWGVKPGEDLVDVPLLRALAYSGNYVTGAYTGDRLVGVEVAFFGDRHLHSHMTGVDRSVRAVGIGFALKQHQRAWTLQRGLDQICWTFDPLVRRNAYFNLHKLGAQATGYLPDFYGVLNDGINTGDVSDRLYVNWRLDSPTAVASAAGEPLSVTLRAPYVLVDDSAGEPTVAALPPASTRQLLVAVPDDIESLRRRSPETGMRWRYAIRDAFLGALRDGYRIAGLTRDGRYVLEPEPGKVSLADRQRRSTWDQSTAGTGALSSQASD